MTDSDFLPQLASVPPIWSSEMDDVVGPHMGTAFPGNRPPVGSPLPPYRWYRVADSTGRVVGFLWLDGDTGAVDISIVIRADDREKGFGGQVLALAEDAIRQNGGTIGVGVVRKENLAAPGVARLLARCGYACFPEFTQELLERQGDITFQKPLVI